MWQVSAAASLVGGGVSLYVLTNALNPTLGGEIFPWHPTLMFSAMALLGPSAAFAVQARKRSLNSSTRLNWTLAHGTVQALAIACAATGFWAIYTHKSNLGKDHFTSRHSMVGLAALGAYTGAAMYAATMTMTKGKGMMPTWRDPLHRMGGALATALGAATICTGIVHERWMPPGLSMSSQLNIAVAACATALAVGVGLLLPASPADDEASDKKDA